MDDGEALGGFIMLFVVVGFVAAAIGAVIAVIAAVAGLVILALLLWWLGVGANVAMRYLIGKIGDEAGATPEAGRYGVTALLLAPVVFMGITGVWLLVRGDGGGLLTWILVGLVSVPAYYIAWYTQTLPTFSHQVKVIVQSVEQKQLAEVPAEQFVLEPPYKTDATMRAEEQIFWGTTHLNLISFKGQAQSTLVEWWDSAAAGWQDFWR